MNNNCVSRYVFKPPDSLQKLNITTDTKNRPKQDKDSIYFKVGYTLIVGNFSDVGNKMPEDRRVLSCTYLTH